MAKAQATCPSSQYCHPTADAAWKLLRLKHSKAWLHTHKHRGLKGGVYRCEQCNYWHITRENRTRGPQHRNTAFIQQEAQL